MSVLPELLLAADSRRVVKQREAELRRVDKRLVEIEADFDKNLDLLKRDLLNEEEFRRVNEARREERSQLEGRREGLAAAVADQVSRQGGVSALPARIKSFLKDFGSLDVRRAKAMLQPILKTVHVYNDGRIELEFREAAN